jgi:hypothetical protein
VPYDPQFPRTLYTESPVSEKNQLGKYERAKIAERTRRGKHRKLRQGKLVAGYSPGYG